MAANLPKMTSMLQTLTLKYKGTSGRNVPAVPSEEKLISFAPGVSDDGCSLMSSFLHYTNKPSAFPLSANCLLPLAKA